MLKITISAACTSGYSITDRIGDVRNYVDISSAEDFGKAYQKIHQMLHAFKMVDKTCPDSGFDKIFSEKVNTLLDKFYQFTQENDLAEFQFYTSGGHVGNTTCWLDISVDKVK